MWCLRTPQNADRGAAIGIEDGEVGASAVGAPRADTVTDVGFALGRVASKLIKATREKVNKT